MATTTITDLIRDQQSRRRGILDRERFVLEDQWDGGKGWTGPLPIDADAQVEAKATDLIKRQFTQRNVLAEVVGRHRDGVVGREPSWTLGADKGNRKQLTKEAEEALTTWWDEAGVHSVLQQAVRTLLYAQEATKGKKEAPRPARSPIRLFIKAASVDDKGRVPKRATLEEALADIGVHAAPPYTAGVLRNLDGDPVASWYGYEDEAGQARTELTGTAKALATYGVDLSTGIPPEATVVAVIDDLGGQLQGHAAYDLGGHMLMHELTREPLIGEAALSQQRLLNKAYSMMSHNLDAAGFTERTLLNAQMPGKWVDAEGKVTLSGEIGARFVPDKLYVGAGATNFFSGIQEVDADGNVRHTSPSVAYRDPVPPDAFTGSADAAEIAVYKEARQLHILLARDATSSGESRKQATNDFTASLDLTAGPVQAGVRWLLATVLALASVLMQQPGRYRELRPTAEARLSAVQPTPEETRVVIERKDAGLLSKTTAMHETGVEDVDAEMELIKKEAVDEPPPPKAPVREPPGGPDPPDPQQIE